MSIVLDGQNLTVDALVRIARFGEPVELAPDALGRIKACRAMLEQKLAAREVMYGTNTGIGEFSEHILTDEQVMAFQRYLDLQPRGRHRRAGARRARPGCLAGRVERPRPRQFGLPARDHPDLHRDAQQGRDAGRVPEGIGGGERRPRADGPGGAAAAWVRARRSIRASACPARRPCGARASPSRASRRATAWRPSTARTC